MARQKRWTIPFKSFNGTDCRVDIYAEGWTGGVTELSPNNATTPGYAAADPFFYEEDDSSDLLGGVLRYRTGYLRLYEASYGALDDLYPTKAFDRYVEFYYGEYLDFTGFFQLQDFSTSLEPAPRLLQFPLISPLGLFDRRKFTPIMPPTTKTLGQLLDMIFATGAHPSCQKVVVPKITGAGLWQTIYSLVVCPWNDDYHHSMNVGAWQKAITSETYEFLIDGICKAFGWICHDTPDALVFTMFDWTGEYCYYEVGHIGDINYRHDETTSAALTPLTNYYTIADDKPKQSRILPDTGIEVSYEGDLEKFTDSFQRTEYDSILKYPLADDDELDERFFLCCLKPLLFFHELEPWSVPTLDSQGRVSTGVHCVAWNGKVGVLLSMWGAAKGTTLFTLRYYMKRVPNRHYAVDYECMTHDYAFSGLTDDKETAYAHLTWRTTEHDDYVELSFVYNNDVNPLPDYYLMFIHDIKFEVYEQEVPYADIRFMPASKSDTIPSTGTPAISSSVNMPFSLYRMNDRMIGTEVRSVKLTEYPYLFRQRIELVHKFRTSAVVEHAPDLLHIRMWSFLSKKWHIIAQAFHPWDDEYTLTMQHSPIFDVNAYTIVANAAAHTNLQGTSVTVYEGDSWEAVLAADEGYRLTSVTILMGGSDVTSSVYDSATGAITIAEVTGNVIITAVVESLGAYDAEVAYLQTDGAAYIDTGFYPKQNSTFSLTFYTPAAFSGRAIWVFGVRNSANAGLMSFLADYTNNQCQWRFGTKSYVASGALAAGEYTFSTLNHPNTLYYGNTSLTVTSSNFTCNYPMYLFALNVNGAPSLNNIGAGIRFMGGRIFDNGTLVRDFIPVRKNGIGYLYDRVSGELFGNAGSGAFTIGPDI